MHPRYALYFIVLLALFSSLTLILYIKYYSSKTQMIIANANTSGQHHHGILHPPPNNQKNTERIYDATQKDVEKQSDHASSNNNEEEKPSIQKQTSLGDSQQSETNKTQNVQQVDSRKFNHKTDIIDGFYDEKIELTVGDVVKGVMNSKIDEQVTEEEAVNFQFTRDPSKHIKCRNTVQGADYITDSRGYICSIMHVDPKTHCCRTDINPEQAKKDGLPPVERYSCSTCNTNNQCCSSYEHCVSCCMDIDKRDDLRKMFQQRKDDKLFKGVKTVFELCLLRCRTTSRSVQNENRFKDPTYRYCYGSIN
ncbi:hypothetical protein FDP41_012210 [Naegleria fowleri]|uniref:SREBP regulating gene protein n=1 Tax=Naegleria fowleri TaxID=5763 RepID=A0A6A5BTX8_NAEFO|nr:uncharacterized protein FDP41_012210 [Naegleria fowleri]KAF0981553.1 hypothetical protein FDP41_012210 [Naegleria fowleri]